MIYFKYILTSIFVVLLCTACSSDSSDRIQAFADAYNTGGAIDHTKARLNLQVLKDIEGMGKADVKNEDAAAYEKAFVDSTSKELSTSEDIVALVNNTNIRIAVDIYFNGIEKEKKQYGEISEWDVSHVTDMSDLFKGAKTFDQNIGGWDVSNVTDMRGMFLEAKAFNQDIRKWDVSKVINMASMFREAEIFNQDLSKWDVSNVTDMGSMFYKAKAFDQDIGGWDVSSVTEMGRMFWKAKAFNHDISKWQVDIVIEGFIVTISDQVPLYTTPREKARKLKQSLGTLKQAVVLLKSGKKTPMNLWGQKKKDHWYKLQTPKGSLWVYGGYVQYFNSQKEAQKFIKDNQEFRKQYSPLKIFYINDTTIADFSPNGEVKLSILNSWSGGDTFARTNGGGYAWVHQDKLFIQASMKNSTTYDGDVQTGIDLMGCNPCISEYSEKHEIPMAKLGIILHPIKTSSEKTNTSLDQQDLLEQKNIKLKAVMKWLKKNKRWSLVGVEQGRDSSQRPSNPYTNLTLDELKDLEQVNLTMTNVTDEDMKMLKHIDRLKEVNLWGTDITEQGLKELKNIKDLTKLNLRKTKTTDKGLKIIATIISLEELDLSRTWVTDTGLYEISSLSSMKCLGLESTRITDDGLRSVVSSMTSLEELYLTSTRITDAIIQDLSQLQNLITLSVLGTKITEEGILKLKENLPHTDI